MLWPASVQYSADALAAAVSDVSRSFVVACALMYQCTTLQFTALVELKANMGGTELMKPLEAVFSAPIVPGYVRQVFVLTDGQVTTFFVAQAGFVPISFCFRLSRRSATPSK